MLLSGGIDSATCLYLMRDKYRVNALTFEYHRIARSELQAAKRIGKKAGAARHRFVRLPDLREAGDIPGFDHGALPSTYIPMRNAVFYSVAASYAEEVGASKIIGGHNKEDALTYLDATPKFFGLLDKVIWQGSASLEANKTSVLLPLKGLAKPEVIKLAASLKVPFELTWSCHRAGTRHCWKCPGCVSRMTSFRKAAVADPLIQGGKLLKG